jgi:hypothetical protein
VDECKTLQSGAAQPSNTLLYDARRREVMLPCYCAVVIKSLRNLDEMEQTVDLSITMVLRIDYGRAWQILRWMLWRATSTRPKRHHTTSQEAI